MTLPVSEFHAGPDDRRGMDPVGHGMPPERGSRPGLGRRRARARVPRGRPIVFGWHLPGPVWWLCPPECEAAGGGGYRGRVSTDPNGSSVVIPISVVDVREAEPLVLEVIRSGIIAQGPMVKRVRGGVRRDRRRPPRRRGEQRDDGARRRPPGARPRARATRSSPSRSPSSPRSTRSSRPAPPPGSPTSARTTSPSTRPPSRPPSATAHEGPHAGAPLRPDRRHGPAHGRSPATAACTSSRTPPRRTAPPTRATAPAPSGSAASRFYATKNLTTGEGGMITTDDDAIADRLRVLRNQGMRQRYQYEMAGHNYRLTDLQAAVGIPQLGRIDEIVERAAGERRAAHRGPGRRRRAVTPPRELPGRTHVWHQYTVLLTDDADRPRRASSTELGRARRRRRHLLPAHSSSTTTATATTRRVVIEHDAGRRVGRPRGACLLPVHHAPHRRPARHDRRVRPPSAGCLSMARPSDRRRRRGLDGLAARPRRSHNSARADLAVVVEPREEVGRAVADRFGARLGARPLGDLAASTPSSSRPPPRPTTDWRCR